MTSNSMPCCVPKALVVVCLALLVCFPQVAVSEAPLFKLVTAAAPWARRSHAYAFQLNDAIVVAGGLNDESGRFPWLSALQDVWASDDFGRTWTARGNLSAPCVSSGSGNAYDYAGAIYLHCQGWFDLVIGYQAYTLVTTDGDTWQRLEPGSADPAMFGAPGVRMAVPFDGVGTLVEVGGANWFGETSNTIAVFTATGAFRNTTRSEWMVLQAAGGGVYQAPWVPRVYASTTVDAEGLVLIMTGGQQQTSGYLFSDTWMMTWTSQEKGAADPVWRVLTRHSEFSGRKLAALYTSHSRLLLYGGSRNTTYLVDGTASDEVWESLNNGSSWSLLSSNGTGCARQASAQLTIGRHFFVIGGSTGSDVHDPNKGDTFAWHNDVWMATGETDTSDGVPSTELHSAKPVLAAATKGGNATLFTLVTRAAPWSPRSLAFGFEWQGELVIAAGLVSTDNQLDALTDVWSSTDGGRMWVERPSLPWECVGSNNAVFKYADRVHLLCQGYMSQDEAEIEYGVISSTDGYLWTLQENDAALIGRAGQWMAVPFDGVGTLFALAGSTVFDSPSNSVEYFSATGKFADGSTDSWTQLQTTSGKPYQAPFAARMYPSTTVDAEGLVLVLTGGEQASGYLFSDVWTMSWPDQSKGYTAPVWKMLTDNAAFSGRKMAAMYTAAGSLILYGGSQNPNYFVDGLASDEVWQSVDNGTSWTLLGNGTGIARQAFTSPVVSSSVFILGGSTGADQRESTSGWLNDVWVADYSQQTVRSEVDIRASDTRSQKPRSAILS